MTTNDTRLVSKYEKVEAGVQGSSGICAVPGCGSDRQLKVPFG